MNNRLRRRSGSALASFFGSMVGKVVMGAVIGGAILGVGYMFFKNLNEAKLRAIEERNQARVERDQALGRVADMERQVTAARDELQSRQLRLALTRVTRRLARIDVLGERQATRNGRPTTEKLIRFREVEERVVDGRRQEVTIGPVVERWLPGSEVFVDGRVIQFDQDYVERGDNLRGSSLAFLERLYTDELAPDEGITLDQRGQRPSAYGAAASDDSVWTRFWELMHDREEQQRRGILTMMGQAVNMRTDVGRSYKIEIRASGGMSFTPDGRPTNNAMSVVSRDDVPADQLRSPARTAATPAATPAAPGSRNAPPAQPDSIDAEEITLTSE